MALLLMSNSLQNERYGYSKKARIESIMKNSVISAWQNAFIYQAFICGTLPALIASDRAPVFSQTQHLNALSQYAR